MTSSNKNLEQVLQTFANSYISAYQAKYNHLPTVEHDDAWLSPCEVTIEQGRSYWQPVVIATLPEFASGEEKISFDNVESALSLTLHPDIKTYFTTLFSESIQARTEDGLLSLLFAWSKEDFARLQENIIGHVLMKQKLKQSETIFFGLTDEEDIIITLDNVSGEIWAERVGCKPHKKISNTLAEFIDGLTIELSAE